MEGLFPSLSGRVISLKNINQKIKGAFNKLREEMDDHLLAINENTNEIYSQYEYICELEKKIEKLTERVEQLQMHTYGKLTFKTNFKSGIHNLSKIEEQVFTVLYTMEEEKGSVTLMDISTQLDIDESEVSNCIHSMAEKGIPITKRVIGNSHYFNVDKDFKMIQVKENVLKLEH